MSSSYCINWVRSVMLYEYSITQKIQNVKQLNIKNFPNQKLPILALSQAVHIQPLKNRKPLLNQESNESRSRIYRFNRHLQNTLSISLDNPAQFG